MKVLVTGGAGFIGANLVDYLSSKGYSVKSLDIKKRQDKEPLHENIIEIVGDITSRETISKAVCDIDIIFHLAGLVTQANVSENDYWKVNVEATRLILEESKKAGVKRFVYCSTDSVSGRIKNPPAKEGDSCCPENIYGVTKHEAEKVVLRFRNNFEVVIARPTRSYGPKDVRILEIFKKIKKGKFILVGSGNILFHPVYISDVIEGMELCGICKNVSGEVFYLGSERPLKLKDFLEYAALALGVRLPKVKIPVWIAESCAFIMEYACPIVKIKAPITRRNLEFFTRDKSYDISKAKQLLGYKPKVDYKEGIKRTIDWYRSNKLL